MSDRRVILAVDEDAAILELIQDVLGDKYEVLTASDALQTVDHLMDREVDILLTALNLPILNGVDLVGKIRSFSSLNDLPIVVVSGFPALVKRLPIGHIQAILPKPFSIAELVRVVEQTLAWRDGRSARCAIPG